MDTNDVKNASETAKTTFQSIKSILSALKNRKFMAAGKECWTCSKNVYAKRLKGKYVEVRGAYADLSGKPAEALELFKKAIDADPFNAAWHYEFGEFLTKAKRTAEAADEYSRAADLDPKNRKYRKAAGR